jgi:proteic killer suppression protein
VDKPCKVIASARFEKQLKKLPRFIQEAALIWVETVEDHGIRQTRKLKGYHDELLSGERKGQRSVRLNRAYRLFYTEDNRGALHLITIEEINKHEY